MTIQPAAVSRVRPLLRPYALSERERQVAVLAADGMPAKDIAAVLYISPHTARDRLKASEYAALADVLAARGAALRTSAAEGSAFPDGKHWPGWEKQRE